MRWSCWIAYLGAVVGLSLPTLGVEPTARPSVLPTTESNEFFEAKVRPLLVEHCYKCHGPDKQKGGLRLDTREGVLKGGESGLLVVPHKPAESRLVRAIRYNDADLRMPPTRQLTEEQIKILEKWIELGVPDPRAKVTGDLPPETEWETALRQRRTWWSLQPLCKPALPPISDAAWGTNQVDRFVFAKLTTAGLVPAPVADRTTLARRLSFALVGLPPTPEQLTLFETDSNPDAYERFVDVLLASPQFGERWARHWLDVARFADTYGYEWDVPAKGAWRYRDYLIRAFNADVPFDQLVREQIAGDLLARPRIDRRRQVNESLIGPTFFMLGEKRHGDSAMFNGIHQEMLHDKIDAFSKAFQATTIGCARCHDHKLDVVSQRDYYALAGILMSARWTTNTLDTPERNRETIIRLKSIKKELRREIGTWWQTAGVADAWRKLPLAQPGGTALPVEHPLHAWQALLAGERDKKEIDGRWNALRATYEKLSSERIAANARDFLVVADFTKGTAPGWSVDGVGLRDGPGQSGDFTVDLTGNRIIGRVLPGGLFSDSLSPRLNGAIRSPFLRQYDKPYLSAYLAGGDFSAERIVIDNAFLAERQSYLSNAALAWRRTSTFPEMRDRRVYVEYATKTSNPNFPPRVGLGGACSEEQAADPRSWFGISRVLSHTGAGTPADELGRFRTLFAGEVPRNVEDAGDRYRSWFQATLDAWVKDSLDDEQVKLLGWLIENDLLPNDRTMAPKGVSERLDTYRETEQRLLEPQTVNGLTDLDPAEDYRLNARGDFDRPTVKVPRGYLGLFGRSPVTGGRSGRLELAEFVASAENPLTARVHVNRIWHWIFGTGLVATPDDFGHLGEQPSHPELLDYLALWFIENGWSTKRLIRLLVTSRTFRQSGHASETALRADPLNRLLHHFPLRRLEAEPIRDAILAASGRLDPTLFGPPLNPHRTHEDPEKRLFSGPLDGAGRRSIYVKLTIMEPARFLAAFNQPPPKITTGRRDSTNVPAQALALLNDPFVVGQAEHWGQAIVKTPHRSVEERLRAMFRVALGRFPSDDELKRWTRMVADLAQECGVPSEKVLTTPGVWKDVAHVLFNTKELIYVR